ncbi:LuxR C-terminal-related transcriptional regulator [Alkalimarinus alittae]|uniref:LuxR C-terminal-related transcriptional regulator n=1 Tax=Alkalimarinus alittae TaxID=2961619 RepID=A0ABY6MZZ0_9ALTE|nr:LuxR C-terminal-related transcriptional regulator [Alkalimarinus alittae]UZE95332.1 LuxR C-terminal-related transcriptional regulator [Alkalimarinus alittae]
MSYEIQRNELLSLLDKGCNYPLTLIVAAPGFGKTTLLNQWQERGVNHTVIRLDLTRRDNDNLSIFKKIFNELKKSTPLWDAPFFNFFKSEQFISEAAMVDILIQAFNLVEEPFVIVIDDFHVIKDPFISSVFSELVEVLPDHVSIILSSRMPPEFPVSRLKLEERILVLDYNDLKLNKHEINQLGEGLSGKALTNEQLVTLYTQTEGWVVGVKLALLTFLKSGDSALSSFNGNQPELLNYFGYEVLNLLTGGVRKFVLTSALFESFNVPLCNAVIGPDSAIIIDKLVRQGLFIMPDQNEQGSFRFHSLLQEFLQGRLLIEEGMGYINSAYRSAAEYFLSQNMLAKAIGYASKCEALDYYYDVLAQSCNQWIKSGEFEAVLGALAGISDQVLVEKYSLSIPLVYALIFSRKFNQAHYYLDLLGNAVDPIEVDVPFLKAVLALFQRDAEAFDGLSFEQFTKVHTNDDMRVVSMVTVAYIFLYKGQLESALVAANDAKSFASKVGHKFLESYADLIVILCDRYMGRGLEAIQYMTDVYRHVDERVESPVWVNLGTGMMVVYYEQNKIDQAIALCQKLLPCVNSSCATEVVANVYLGFSRLLHIKGEQLKAFKLLDQLNRILVFGRYDRFQSQIVQELMRQAITDESSTSVDSIAEKYGLLSWIEQEVWRDEAYYQESKERYSLASAYWLTSKGRYDRASDILTKLVTTLEKQGIKTRALIARCNLLVVNYLQGNQDVAINQLKKTLDQYGLVCFSRSVFDEAPGLDTVFKQAIRQNRLELPIVYSEQFEELLNETRSVDDVAVNPKTLLTGKEMEIFELLAAGLPNLEISKQTGIALSTTKWHLKNIYGKLGVSNRSAAMMVAHQR